MTRFRKFIKTISPYMIFFLPIWITYGRGFLGSGGWLSLIFLFSFAPILLIGLLIVQSLIKTRPDVQSSNLFGKTDSLLLATVYVTTILLGLFVADGSDSIESFHSVMALAGVVSINVSAAIGVGLSVTSLLSLVALFIIALIERVKKVEL